VKVAWEMNPKFTVIIATYNAGATLRTAIDSILSQTFTAYEIQVVDGQSEDDTVSILQQYASSDERIKWTSEKDDGIYDALNKGIKRSTGEWLYFLGSDDSLYDNGVLETIANTAAQNADAEMIYGNVLLSDFIGFDHHSKVFAGEFHSNRVLQMNMCHQAVFYRRSLFEKFGLYNTRYKLLADWDFNLRCYNRIKSIYTGGIVANFTAGGASGAEKRDDAFFNDWLKNFIFTYPYDVRHPFLHRWRKGLSALLVREIFSLRLGRAFTVAKVLGYHMMPAKKRAATRNFNLISPKRLNHHTKNT
jgi:glycosyltransferase involved in cell wall biosynthesis